ASPSIACRTRRWRGRRPTSSEHLLGSRKHSPSRRRPTSQRGRAFRTPADATTFDAVFAPRTIITAPPPARSMRKIDVFTHIFPAPYQAGVASVAPNVKDIGKRMRGIPMLVDLDERFRVMDRFEGYQQVLSIATPPIELFAPPADAIDLAKAANDGMAELVGR